jgi:Raf kinase inhibitor-like YbhB/YbcL family protein
MTLSLISPRFDNGGDIPARYTCDGDDISPPLSWSGLPPETRSLALIVDDPDARAATWVHWVAYNIPAMVTGLAENASGPSMPAGAREGLNDWKAVGYRGPCPPSGSHRYFFKLYALDISLPPEERATKTQIENAMSGHVLARVELMGQYRHK